VNDEIWTVSRLAEAAAEVFVKRGIEGARLDADLLLAEVLGLERIELYTRFDMPVAAEQRARYRDFVKRRAAREPVAYILGRREFYEHSFRVSPAVLVPRPETELIVDLGRAHLESRAHEAPRILDLGTGSGCILLSLLALFPGSRGLGVDISPAALEVASANAEDLELADRVQWREGDFLDALRDEDRAAPFDLVVTNPPYIGRDEAPSLPPDVIDYEPELALFAPGDPLVLHLRLVDEFRRISAPEGLVLMEMGAGGGAELSAEAGRRDKHAHRGLARDLAGIERVFALSAAPFCPRVVEALES
jgi:release factor glutamine methyltransferase